MIYCRTLIQYGVKTGDHETQKTGRFNIMVMGSSKVGKTKFIRELRQLEGGKPKQIAERMGNVYEYREFTVEQDFLLGTSAPPLRTRAIATGDLFVLLFSLNNIESFNFVYNMRREIVDKKSNTIPIIFVGLKFGQCGICNESFALSQFADYVFYYPESCYFELSMSDEDVLRNLHDEILVQQENYHTIIRARQAKLHITARNFWRKLVSVTNTLCNINAVLSR